jgi:hypothetical protein
MQPCTLRSFTQHNSTSDGDRFTIDFHVTWFMTATEDAQQKSNSVCIRQACGSFQAKAERPLSAAVRVDAAPQTPDTVAASAGARPDGTCRIAENPPSSGRAGHRKVTLAKFRLCHGLAVSMACNRCVPRYLFFSLHDNPFIEWRRRPTRDFRVERRWAGVRIFIGSACNSVRRMENQRVSVETKVMPSMDEVMT